MNIILVLAIEFRDSIVLEAINRTRPPRSISKAFSSLHLNLVILFNVPFPKCLLNDGWWIGTLKSDIYGNYHVLIQGRVKFSPKMLQWDSLWPLVTRLVSFAFSHVYAHVKDISAHAQLCNWNRKSCSQIVNKPVKFKENLKYGVSKQWLFVKNTVGKSRAS